MIFIIGAVDGSRRWFFLTAQPDGSTMVYIDLVSRWFSDGSSRRLILTVFLRGLLTVRPDGTQECHFICVIYGVKRISTAFSAWEWLAGEGVWCGKVAGPTRAWRNWVGRQPGDRKRRTGGRSRTLAPPRGATWIVSWARRTKCKRRTSVKVSVWFLSSLAELGACVARVAFAE
ncbi:hypothetical protein BU26DRAFT_264230 [Trematosphaeria pertusa]|uniref:Uncharacterized protein n=1 Tax=Trematosphaeria pertusa TaxID=390896 RepID=A0A6A6IIQ4_9PLEO|nr:uncharacterized protein BU26DRAFT_264230 [Trematosphaeria pertusa]KAF2250485.1 hypothetical protein BU26DRAFT_264230 [Trematosphaeria pertusa]